MNCPHCRFDDSKVVDSRDSGHGIRRGRECLDCGMRFTTHEKVQTRDILVIKRDSRREDFNRDKLLEGVMKACAKRPLPTESIVKMVQDIETNVSGSGRQEITSEAIGRFVMDSLKGLDRVAYIRYASIYRDFRDVETFKEEIDSLLKPRNRRNKSENQLSFLEEEIEDIRKVRRAKPKKPNNFDKKIAVEASIE